MKPFSVMCLFVLVFGVVGGVEATESAMVAKVTDKDRCAVCGMFVAKYPPWITQIELSDGKVLMFDGPKDMFVFYLSPKEYGVGDAQIKNVVVKDYYTQKWLDGRAALYVTGSDVFGPMGHELIPFETKDAAQNFLQDHHGKKILTFEQVTDEIVQPMRKGHKMKRQMKK